MNIDQYIWVFREGGGDFSVHRFCRVVYLKQNCTCKRIKFVNEAECKRSMGGSGVDVQKD